MSEGLLTKNIKEHEITARPWIKRFARLGYFAKGFVYILIGVLSMLAAFGVGGGTKDATGAFAAVASEPYGEILLWVIAAGLAGYVSWRFIQIIFDPEEKGFDMKGILIKLGYLISGIIYSGLIFKAVKIALHSSSGNSGGSKKTMLAKVMAEPFGQWAVGLVGIGIIIFGIYEFYYAFKGKFAEKFKKHKMNKHEWELGIKSGKIGLSARGVVFCIIGYFVTMTAYTAKPSDSISMDGALLKIAQQPFGQWMLAIVAIGLSLYGVFQIVKGKNRYMQVIS
ncbi:DUF1206 domain-containing protein [Falsibacillus albus]|uniref:DUF1206 domain-containing protein n=1 Tax=Falsibacillus albus TaxID=2478915 RepID=A0A3L7JZF3_9BACI|nr:DUF1206 domain-containing protein [Falsibacillus albus]RLQ95519.1 DUF1206 domain-containing protein [Falsibacillus albus]